MSDAILNEFLKRLSHDRERGVQLPLSVYQAAFPGHDDLIAAEWEALSGGVTPASRPILDHGQLPPGTRLGAYSIVELLGRGGQGCVYLAMDERLRREVALKVLDRATGFASGALTRFKREAEVQASLDHPGICAVYEAGEADGLRYLAMRRVVGRSLSEIINEVRTHGEGRFPEVSDVKGLRSALRKGQPEPLLQFLSEVAEALAAAHRSGVVHRDVKAGNILVSETGSPILTDFGLARTDADGESITGSLDIIGTPAYLAPEQITGKDSDARTDVYALGVVMYEILTLRRPFQGVQREALFRAILESDVPDPRVLNPLVSKDAWTVLEKALSKDPGQRYPSAAEMSEDLRRLASGRSVSARPLSAAERLWRRVRRKPLVAVVALLALALLFGLGYGIARWPEIMRGRQALRVSTQREELTRAFAHLTEGDQDAARALFDRILREDATSTLALAGLVLSDAESDPERALTACNRYAATTADPAALEFLRGDLLSRLKRMETVDVSSAKGAIAAYIKGSVQMLHVRTGRLLHEAAARAFREAIMLSNEDYPFFYFSLAESIGGLSDAEEARKIASVILSKWPSSPHAHYYAGRALREADPNAAAAHFDSASRNPELAASAHKSAARLHLTKTRNIERAKQHLAALQALSVQSYDVHALEVLRSELSKDGAAALQSARTLTESYPKMGKAWLVLAQQEIQRGARAEALASARRALKEDPYFWRGMAFLGWLLAGEGDIAQATHWLKRAMEEEPRALRPKCDLGLAYMAIRQETQAIPLLEECVASEDPAIRVAASRSLAHAYLTRGRAEDALVALRSARPSPADRDQRLLRRAVLRQETPLAERRSESADDDLLQAMDLESAGLFEDAAAAWTLVRDPLTPSPPDHPRIRAAICLLRAANAESGSGRMELAEAALTHLTLMVNAYSKTVVGFRVLAHGLVLEPNVGMWFHGAAKDEAQDLLLPIVDELRTGLLER